MGESRVIAAAVALALSVAPRVAYADEPLQLAPTSRWTVERDDDSCAARRNFGFGSRSVWLELRQSTPNTEFLVTVATRSFKMIMRAPRSRFLPAGPIRTQDLAAFIEYPDGAKGIIFPGSLLGDAPLALDDVAWDALESSITGLQIEGSFDEDFILQIGELKTPMSAMRTCLGDLLRSWKIDPAVQLTLKQPAMPLDQRSWAAPIQQFYPRGLLYVRGNPYVAIRLLIDEAGKVETCQVQRPVLDPSYEERICGIIMKRAEFSAALDAQGQPVRSLYFVRIVYST